MSTTKNNSAPLDRSVIYLFFLVFLVAFTTLAFKYANEEPCDEAVFVHFAKKYEAGEMIKFNDQTVGAQEWQWNFGDGSEESVQKNPLHIFENEGEYEVRLLVNNSCKRKETIIIKERTVLLDSTKFPVFDLPKIIVIGETLTVIDETDNATSWEWRFGETASANSISKSAEYIYKEPGLKTVSLIVNGDMTYIAKKRINVLPLPESKKKITPIAHAKRDKRLDLRKAPAGMVAEKTPDNRPNIVPFITEDNFKIKLKMMASKKLKPKSLSAYLCEDGNPLIVFNGRSTTFLDFQNKIIGKNIKIKSLSIKRNTGSNCITTFDIKY
ncbi:PKD domain-containing protein [uncultured Zobellia sp.]|uniref:PKD domain-containing protein n=1 Tax=uncultured Zobellia sp. TaxID=255433 RepID=UPI002599C7FB|nr:PKD domain-containing protein [uncultured Zobellia sp.]